MSKKSVDRREFLGHVGAGSLATTILGGFVEQTLGSTPKVAKKFMPISDRKIRVGIVGHGQSKWGAVFGFQNHPNVEVVAVSDLFADRCQALATACRCENTYESLDALLKDSQVEAVFVATDAPSHAQHAMQSLRHDKHVFCAVPATFGSIDEGEQLLETVRSTGLTYMMAETTAFQADCYAMRQLYQAGGFGRVLYSEGEYSHYCPNGVLAPSYKDWRQGVPPLWYSTHSTAYYVNVTGKQFTAVSAIGAHTDFNAFKPENNQYKNRFTDGYALFQTEEGGASRMSVCWSQYGYDVVGGRINGDQGWMIGVGPEEEKTWQPSRFATSLKEVPDLVRPALPEGMPAGGHGGSHGLLTNEFISALLQQRRPAIDVYDSLAMTIPGIVAQKSALRDGELLKIPQFDPPNGGKT